MNQRQKAEIGDQKSPFHPFTLSPLRLLTLFLALGIWAWAFTDPRFREAEGFFDGYVTFPLSLGTAVLIMGWWGYGRTRRFFLWLALGLVGQAAALQLILAGSPLRYQHYKPLQTHPEMLIIVTLQTGLVAWGLSRQWRKIWDRLNGRLAPWQILLLAAIIFIPAATVSEDPLFFLFDLTFAIFIQAINLGNLVLILKEITTETQKTPTAFQKLLRALRVSLVNPRPTLDRFAWGTAVWVILIAAILNIFSYQQHPHVTDEFAYIYHARYLAEGKLTSPAPAVPEAFEVYLMQFDGDVWYPSPPPGWPAILSIGTRLGADWLVNPILGGLNLLLAYLLLQSIYKRRTARIAVFLLAVSPWYVFLAMSYMTHTASLTVTLLAAIGVDWARRTGRSGWAWLGGVALGMLALIRPLEAVVIALLLGLWAIGLGGQRLKLTGIAGLVLGAMLAGSAALVYNETITGDPTLFPIMAYTNERFGPNANALGFGPDRGMGWALDPFPGHSPRDALINADLNGFMINFEMTGWSIGSLLFAGLLLVTGKLRRGDWLMLAAIALIFTVHFFYYYSGGPDFGARYWFLMIVPIAALTARGIERAENLVGKGAKEKVVTAVLILSFMAVINIFPWRAVDKYHNFREMRPDVRQLAAEHDFGRALILVTGNSNPDYASAAIYNPVDMTSDAAIYAWDNSPAARTAVLQAYADRPVWLINGPTITGAGYDILAGPLTAAEALSRSNE